MLIMATRYSYWDVCSTNTICLKRTIHTFFRSLNVYSSVFKKLAEAKLHLQSYLSESFAVAISSAAIEVSASTLLVYISKDASVGSVPVLDTYFKFEGEVTYGLEVDKVESNFVLWRQYVLHVAFESHFFHWSRASAFRMPWRTKISIPWQPTKIVKRSCNVKVASTDGVPLAASPNPQPSPNSIARLKAIVAFFQTNARLLSFLCLLRVCLQMDIVIRMNMIKLKV